MKDGRCSKFYPKPFSNVTVLNVEMSKPVYKRTSPAQGGRQVIIQRSGKDYTVDSSWVVPHPPASVLRFNSHINLEVCVSSSGVKYLTGYFHKGSDRAMVQAQVEGEHIDEVKEYVDHRVMCANEAVAGLLGFEVHQSFPPVMPLRIHLEGEQQVTFEEGDEQAAVENPKMTELTAFFDFNRLPEERMKSKEDRPRYVEMPEKHVYNKGAGSWTKRKRAPDVIGRVHMPSVLSGDVIYLRMLLHDDACRGVESFEQMKAGCETYKETCCQLGLLQVNTRHPERSSCSISGRPGVGCGAGGGGQDQQEWPADPRALCDHPEIL
jgi:hypothetical protein